MKEGRLDINLFKHSLEQISRIENYIAIRKKKKRIHVIS